MTSDQIEEPIECRCRDLLLGGFEAAGDVLRQVDWIERAEMYRLGLPIEGSLSICEKHLHHVNARASKYITRRAPVMLDLTSYDDVSVAIYFVELLKFIKGNVHSQPGPLMHFQRECQT